MKGQAQMDLILNLIYEGTKPELMSKVEALEFLEELSAEIEMNIDCLRSEIRNG